MIKPKAKKRLKRDIFTILTVLFGMLFIAGCGGGWTGTGVVVDKNMHDAGYRPVSWSQKNEWMPECYELIIRDNATKELEKGCVSEYIWQKATVDQPITISKEDL
ncbi:membrane protein [Arthrobacter phage Trustiboi]|uniref:Membrane protein n=1 Tax=Arthrobacter phage Trustiboi TaxID=2951391 RepID=A0A9E7SY11_9CAUD|nr:membrane protein [Arthrobacter phage Trustiboi]UTN91626.1 membrane protein [Arthrobacter phage Trustiboi]